MANVSGATIQAPWMVKLINQLGHVFERIGLPFGSLDATQWMAKASRQTGLQDFGDSGFNAGLNQLARSLQSEAALNPLGRIVADDQITALLGNRLRLIDYLKTHPGIETQPVSRPLFIAGLPRTGTTILHAMLAQDPQARAPLSWEVMAPCPPQKGSDKRIKIAERKLQMLCKFIPHFEAIHPVGALLPQECISLTAFEFVSVQFMLNFEIPSYSAWYLQQDQVPAFKRHKQVLQLLNYFNPGQRWVLKTPAHLGSLEAIFAVYPDALIIQTHRDPAQVIPSTTSLFYALHQLSSATADPVREGATQQAFWSQQLNKAMDFRAANPQRAAQFHDVYFEDLMHDPIAAISNIYQHFDMDLSPEARQAMQTFLVDNGRDKHGKHNYSASQYGITEAQLLQHFGRYYDHFQLDKHNTRGVSWQQQCLQARQTAQV